MYRIAVRGIPLGGDPNANPSLNLGSPPKGIGIHVHEPSQSQATVGKLTGGGGQAALISIIATALISIIATKTKTESSQ